MASTTSCHRTYMGKGSDDSLLLYQKAVYNLLYAFMFFFGVGYGFNVFINLHFVRLFDPGCQ